MIENGKPTGSYTNIEVLEVKRDHVSQEPRSVRVTSLQGSRETRRKQTVWVQACYLSPLVPETGADEVGSAT